MTMFATTGFPFGKHKGRPLGDVPADYLLWAIRTIKLSSGLRAAVTEELRSRGVETPPAPPPPPPPRCWRCRANTQIHYSWHEDSLGRKRIKRTCKCGGSLGFAPHTAELVKLADASLSETALLDVLTQTEERGIVLESDGRRVWVKEGWRQLDRPLKEKLGQVQHRLAKMLGNTRGTPPATRGNRMAWVGWVQQPDGEWKRFCTGESLDACTKQLYGTAPKSARRLITAGRHPEDVLNQGRPVRTNQNTEEQLP